MSIINRLPWGLQSLLGSNSQGDNPNNLLRDVRASFDMFPLWGVDALAIGSNSGNAAVVGQATVITVPSGEIWIPITVGGFIGATTIGDELGIAIVSLDPTSTQTTRLSASLSTVMASNNEVVSQSVNFPTPVAYGPGWSFGVVCTAFAVAAGTRSFGTQVVYWKMEI